MTVLSAGFEAEGMLAVRGADRAPIKLTWGDGVEVASGALGRVRQLQRGGWVERRGSAGMEVGLDRCGASFEASLCEAPQDDEFI